MTIKWNLGKVRDDRGEVDKVCAHASIIPMVGGVS